MNVKAIFEEFDKAKFEITKKVGHKIREGIDSSIGHAHLYLLLFIKNEGDSMVTDIAKHLNITLSAVTNLTDKLYNLGLIVRDRSESDRRVVVIKITDEGKKVLEKLAENRTKIFSEMFCDFSTDEIETFLKFLKKLTENAKKSIDL